MWRNLLTGLIFAFAVSLVQAAVLEDIRFNRLDNKVQLVLDMDSATTFQQFSLADPPRIVLDFPDSQRRGRAGIEINQGSVASIRTGYRTQDKLRVVVDLINVAKANIYTLVPQDGRGNRIVVDVYDDNWDPALTLTSLNGGQMPFVVFAGTALEDQASYNPGISRENDALAVLNPPSDFQVAPIQTIAPASPPLTVERQISPSGEVEGKITINRPVIAVKRDIVVCVDPGHGGKDPGAHSTVTGAREKDAVLAIGKRLRTHLNTMPGYRVVMTRDSDTFIPLYQRPAKCRDAGGDLFVSIHADAVESQQPSGSSVYILSTRGASSQLAKYLAKKENAVDLKWGVDVSKYDNDIQQALLNIQQEATLESSHILAQETIVELGKIGNVHKSGVERANFVVLRSPEIPSMLVETAFISNPSEARLLATASYQDKLARGIAAGIDRYFREHLPQHMLLEQ